MQERILGLISRNAPGFEAFRAEPHNPCPAKCASAGGREGRQSERICPEDLPVFLLVRRAKREKEQAYQDVHL